MISNESKTFKLLFVTADKYPPFRVDLVNLFAEEMSQRGHEIDWVMQSEADCTAAYQTAWGGGTAYVGATSNGETRLKRIKKHALAFIHDFSLFRIMRSRSYDFLQVRDKYVVAVPAMLAAKLFKAKFVLWLSFPFPEAWIHYVRDGSARYPLFYLLRGNTQKFLLYKILAPAAKHIFLQSPEMKRMCMEQGIAESKLTVVPMGYSSPKQNSQATNSDRENNNELPLSVVYIGSLCRNRRIDFVLRAFRLVLDEIPNATLYLVGGGDVASDDKIIADECSRLKLESHVKLPGFLPQLQAFDYVRQASVCISPIFPDPILNAGSPTKLVEYMAFGKAVVANDQIEQRQILEASDGGLCVPWEEHAYADAIIKLLRDPAKAARMGEAGKRYIEKHRNYSYIASEVEKVYLRMCED